MGKNIDAIKDVLMLPVESGWVAIIAIGTVCGILSCLWIYGY